MHRYQVGDIVLIKENVDEGSYASSYPNELIHILTQDPTADTLYTFELVNRTPAHKIYDISPMYIKTSQIKSKFNMYGTSQPIKGSK